LRSENVNEIDKKWRAYQHYPTSTPIELGDLPHRQSHQKRLSVMVMEKDSIRISGLNPFDQQSTVT